MNTEDEPISDMSFVSNVHQATQNIQKQYLHISTYNYAHVRTLLCRQITFHGNVK